MKIRQWSVVMLLSLVVLGLVLVGCDTPTATSQASSSSLSLTDQVTQALRAWKVPQDRTITEGAAGVITIVVTASGGNESEADSLAYAVNGASNYEKSIWQAPIAGLNEVTVVVVQTDYPESSGNLVQQDVVKATVLQATGTTLDWNSGTPAEQFRRFDVHWVITDGMQEP